MARLCAVEIYLSRLFVIEIVYRYRIWISAVAVDCEHSAAGGAQNFFCRFFAESVFNSANRSEHNIVSGDFEFIVAEARVKIYRETPEERLNSPGVFIVLYQRAVISPLFSSLQSSR